jgi:hypothetical protein
MAALPGGPHLICHYFEKGWEISCKKSKARASEQSQVPTRLYLCEVVRQRFGYPHCHCTWMAGRLYFDLGLQSLEWSRSLGRAFQRLGIFSAAHPFAPDTLGSPETSRTPLALTLLRPQHLFHHPLLHSSSPEPRTKSPRMNQDALPRFHQRQIEKSMLFICSSGNLQQKALPIAIR